MQQDFYEFLLRRRGYACIEFGDLDNAKKICSTPKTKTINTNN